MACYLVYVKLLFLFNLCNLNNVISFFQCLANLARWQDLEQCTVESIDDTNPPDLDRVWTDTFFQVMFAEKTVSCKQLTFTAEQCSSLVIPHSVKHPACADNWKPINVSGEGSDVVCVGVRVGRDQPQASIPPS